MSRQRWPQDEALATDDRGRGILNPTLRNVHSKLVSYALRHFLHYEDLLAFEYMVSGDFLKQLRINQKI
jgi:hypothetical protein